MSLEQNYDALEKYATNLTALAKKGKLDPVIGRHSEIDRVIRTLSRRTKNNAILVGPPGTGKTAIAAGMSPKK
jgi:ATP-dependent Clp protease ATP-binding subunit ClpB